MAEFVAGSIVTREVVTREVTITGPVSLAAAVAEAGSTPKTIQFSEDQVLSANFSSPATLELLPLSGAKIICGSYSFSYLGNTSRWPTSQVISTSGTVSGLKEVRPEWFGTENTAIVKAVATGAQVKLRAGTYLAGAAMTLASGQEIVGASKTGTVIKKAFNGDLLTMGEGSGIVSLTLDGDGNNFTGRNIVISGTNGRQYGRDFRSINAASYSLEYTDSTAGSQDSWVGGHFNRINGITPGNYAVKIPDAAAANAVPHKFSNIETDGGLFMDFGGCDSVFLDNCYSGGHKFTTNSRSVHISNGRIRGEVGDTLEIKGSGHTLTGLTIYPEVILAAGTNSNKLVGNAYNNGVTDNANSPTNEFSTPTLSYTPAWTSDGTAPALGNGTISGAYRHEGTKWIVDITLTMGSTTTYGTGIYYFSIPSGTTAVLQRFFGSCRLVHSGLTVPARSVLVTDKIRLNFDSFVSVVSPIAATGGGTVQATSPWTWASGDTINIHFEYND